MTTLKLVPNEDFYDEDKRTIRQWTLTMKQWRATNYKEHSMSAALAEALDQLHLQPGQTYRVSVNGYDVEVRVRSAPKADSPEMPVAKEEPPRFADQVMLEPWVTFPDPPPAGTVIARHNPLPLPDPPEIPPAEELP